MPDETAADKRCKVVCKKVYKKTLAIYKSSRFENGRHDYGFKILNGPPRFKPPILFISYQPGGGKNAKVPFIRNHRSWPSTLEYLRDKAPETGKKYAL
jgi:hypothetical protein